MANDWTNKIGVWSPNDAHASTASSFGFEPAVGFPMMTVGFPKRTDRDIEPDEQVNLSDDGIINCTQTTLTVWKPFDPSARRPPPINQVKNWIQELRTQKLDSELHLPATISKSARADLHSYCRKLGLQSVSYGKGVSRYLVIRPKGGTLLSQDRAQTAAAEKAIKFGFDELAKMKEIVGQFPPTDADVAQIEEIQKSRHLNTDDRLFDMACLPNTRATRVPVSHTPRHLRASRDQLPVTRYRGRIVDAIDRYDVVIISGGTGTGKSTQVPQYVLETACERNKPVRVVCTQPRRLPAMSVAERVCEERGEQIGHTVGYHIRLKRKISRETVLTFCTPGVLLRTIKTKRLSDVTHVFLDEVHERDMETDYLLAVLRDIQQFQRANGQPPIKIILMSATMEANLKLFNEFFYNAVHVEVEGRMFDVATFHLEDVLSMIRYQPETLVEVGTFDASQLHTLYNVPDSAWDEPDPPAGPSVSLLAPKLLNASADDVELLSDNDEESTSMWNNSMVSGEQHQVRVPDVDLDRLPPIFDPMLVTPEMRIGQCKRAKALLAKYVKSRDAMHLVDRTDIQLAVEAAVYANNSDVPGAILVFLTGYDDINTMRKMLLTEQVVSRCRHQWHIFMLHSEMDARHQHAIFARLNHGRKIILSTNIAEASLTIDDVVFVIDCGRVKEKRYYPKTHISTLLPVGIAKSNAEQRRGRAGRCQKGYCFRLYTSDEYKLMPLAATPEIKRIAIHEICLHARQMADDEQTIAQFLSKCPEPPDAESIAESVEYLKLLSALAADEHLTCIGRVMTELPLDPRYSRMLLWAITLRCLEPVLTITAMMSYRDPFMIPAGERRHELDEIRGDLAKTDLSDHIMYLRAYYQAQQVSHVKHKFRTFCDKMYISMQNMEMCFHIRGQLLNELCRLKLVSAHSWRELNENSDRWVLVKAALVGGSHPAIGFVGDSRRYQKIKTVREANCELAPGCALKFESQRIRRGKDFKYIRDKGAVSDDDDSWHPPPDDVRWVMYSELTQLSRRVVLKNVTAISPMMVCLFGGTSSIPASFGCEEKKALSEDGENTLELADWLKCNMATRSLIYIHRIRVYLHALFIRCIDANGVLRQRDQMFMNSLQALLRMADKSSGFVPVTKCLHRDHPWPKTHTHGTYNNLDSQDYNNRHAKSSNNGYSRSDSHPNGGLDDPSQQSHSVKQPLVVNDSFSSTSADPNVGFGRFERRPNKNTNNNQGIDGGNGYHSRNSNNDGVPMDPYYNRQSSTQSDKSSRSNGDSSNQPSHGNHHQRSHNNNHNGRRPNPREITATKKRSGYTQTQPKKAEASDPSEAAYNVLLSGASAVAATPADSSSHEGYVVESSMSGFSTSSTEYGQPPNLKDLLHLLHGPANHGSQPFLMPSKNGHARSSNGNINQLPGGKSTGATSSTVQSVPGPRGRGKSLIVSDGLLEQDKITTANGHQQADVTHMLKGLGINITNNHKNTSSSSPTVPRVGGSKGRGRGLSSMASNASDDSHDSIRAASTTSSSAGRGRPLLDTTASNYSFAAQQQHATYHQ